MVSNAVVATSHKFLEGKWALYCDNSMDSNEVWVFPSEIRTWHCVSDPLSERLLGSLTLSHLLRFKANSN